MDPFGHSRRRSPHIGPLTALALACVTALVAAGCGGSSSSSPPPDYAKALSGAPPPLAKLYSQGNKLVAGGEEALNKRLESLRGYPVVVNFWASWCGPCIEEFPVFQKLSARFGTRVAFIGVNSEDSEEGAARLLARAPVPYPSYVDSDGDIKQSFETRGLPATAFFDQDGKLIWRKLGPYRDNEELESEIREFALQDS